jgi:hypothetical protein
MKKLIVSLTAALVVPLAGMTIGSQAQAVAISPEGLRRQPMSSQPSPRFSLFIAADATAGTGTDGEVRAGIGAAMNRVLVSAGVAQSDGVAGAGPLVLWSIGLAAVALESTGLAAVVLESIGLAAAVLQPIGLEAAVHQPIVVAAVVAAAVVVDGDPTLTPISCSLLMGGQNDSLTVRRQIRNSRQPRAELFSRSTTGREASGRYARK